MKASLRQQLRSIDQRLKRLSSGMPVWCVINEGEDEAEKLAQTRREHPGSEIHIMRVIHE